MLLTYIVTMEASKKVNVAGRIYSCYYDNGFNVGEPDLCRKTTFKNNSRVIYVRMKFLGQSRNMWLFLFWWSSSFTEPLCSSRNSQFSESERIPPHCKSITPLSNFPHHRSFLITVRQGRMLRLWYPLTGYTAICRVHLTISTTPFNRPPSAHVYIDAWPLRRCRRRRCRFKSSPGTVEPIILFDLARNICGNVGKRSWGLG